MSLIDWLGFFSRCIDLIPNYESANREGAQAWGDLVKSKVAENQ
jgi:hypothetical protein